jgi:hypothetical protein
MLLALQNNNAKDVVEKAIETQKTKYLTSPAKESPNIKNNLSSNTILSGETEQMQGYHRCTHLYFAGESDHPWPRRKTSCKFLFYHLKKHGFSFLLNQKLDELQIIYLFFVSWQLLNKLDDDTGLSDCQRVAW